MVNWLDTNNIFDQELMPLFGLPQQIIAWTQNYENEFTYIKLYAVTIYVAPQLFRSTEENYNQSLFG